MCCLLCLVCCVVFFFKQKTAYEMRISDWSSDVCSSDLAIDEVISVSEDAIGSPPPGMQGIWGDITTGMIRISERRRALVIRPEYFVEAVEGRSADLNQALTPVALEALDSLRSRSEARRVGKQCVSTCRSRWAQYHKKKKNI